jgi:hypothetical protein
MACYENSFTFINVSFGYNALIAAVVPWYHTFLVISAVKAYVCIICFWLRDSVEVEVKLRPTVSRPVLLCVRHPSWTRDQFFFLLEIFFRQLRVCYFVAPSLTRGRACNLLLLVVLASAVLLRSESRGTQGHILLPTFLWLPQPRRARPPYLYPPGTGWLRYTPGHWVSFPSPLTTRRATMEVFYPSSTRECWETQTFPLLYK